MKALMVCSGGMSSTIVVKALRQEAEKQGFDLEIDAVGTGEVEDELSNVDYDVLLVAPQVKHLIKRFEEYAKNTNTKLMLIEPTGYTPFGAAKTFETLKTYQ
ncbi:PTS sugar transporter subunit IIB [Granulicatella seriolae]|uniref:PTS sugar transporter subunit IIB n=1 Tax=Granulicatella seriolae TaxID=2967226 RepID=A0ABT1WLW5_9LACT|nr:PTS sugar transporter subunit IIB [Granulicatella seriolae]